MSYVMLSNNVLEFPTDFYYKLERIKCSHLTVSFMLYSVLLLFGYNRMLDVLKYSPE